MLAPLAELLPDPSLRDPGTEVQECEGAWFPDQPGFRSDPKCARNFSTFGWTTYAQ
jgi:hypothetical protein